MAKKDKDRDEESSAPSPVVAATPKPASVQRDAEKTVGIKPNPSPQAPATSGPPKQDPAGYGNNKWGGHGGGSLSGTTGSGGPGKEPVNTPAPPTAPPKGEVPKETQGRSKQRASDLSLSRSPAGRTQDAASKKQEPRREQRDTKKAETNRSPAGRTQDAARKKPDVVCKAPPRGSDTKPKGGGGSGKRFIPYQGSKYCK